jgi:hypothetical protein
MLTKDDILKMTGLNEKDFYKQFPNPKDFQAKYGKKIDKFLRKKSIEKAQTGWQDTFTPAPLEMEDFGFNKNQRAINKDARQFRKETINQGVGNQQQQNVMFPNFKNITSEDVDTGFQAASAIGSSVQNYLSARDKKKKAKEMNEFLTAYQPLMTQANQGDMDRPRRNYFRPDDPDFLIQPDTLHNPMGTGSGMYAKNGGEISNTFAPNTIYTDLGKADSGAIIEGIKTAGDIAAFIGGINTKKIQKENERMMGQIGTSPMIQNLQANQYGSYMEYGGTMNPTAAMGENLQVDDRGDIDFMGYNPEIAKTGASGFVGISRGPSHENGGFNLAYGEKGLQSENPSVVELEGNETVLETAENGLSNDKSLNILGNRKIGKFKDAVVDGINQSLLGKISKGGKIEYEKFKNVGNKIAKHTKKINGDELKYLEYINSDDQLTASSGKAGLKGVRDQYKKLKMLLDNLIDTQKEMNNISDSGIDVDRFARTGEIKKGKNNKSSAMAQNGITKSKEDSALELYNSGKIKDFQQYVASNFPEMTEKIINEKGLPKKGWADNIKGPRTMEIAKQIENLKNQNEYQLSPEMIAGLQNITGASNQSVADIQSRIETDMNNLKSIYTEPSMTDPPPKGNRFNENIADSIMMYANQLLPFIRPSDAEGLTPEQISGELMSLATDQVDPVQAQKYIPALRSFQNISLQDQINQITADQRALLRNPAIQSNPALQANIAAQAYGQKTGVLAQQFRENQAAMQNTIESNLAEYNKAQGINLGLFDTQYQRQQQAISNTKAARQAAVNSINAKIIENRREQREIQLGENLYAYRFGKNNVAMNMNPLARFDTGMDIPVLDENGNVVEYKRQVKEKTDKSGLPAGREVTTQTRSKASNGQLVKSYK